VLSKLLLWVLIISSCAITTGLVLLYARVRYNRRQDASRSDAWERYYNLERTKNKQREREEQ
jgi:hypothetical protein